MTGPCPPAAPARARTSDDCWVCDYACGSPTKSLTSSMRWSITGCTPPGFSPQPGDAFYWLYGDGAVWWRTAYGWGAA